MRNRLFLITLFVILVTSLSGNVWTFFEMVGVPGSPLIGLFIFVGVIILIASVFFLDTERRNHLLALIQGERSSKDYNIVQKKSLYPKIKTEMASASKEVVVLGALSSSFMNVDFYSSMAQLLVSNLGFRLRLYLPSTENIQKRLDYLERPTEKEDYRDWNNKRGKVSEYMNFDELILAYVHEDMKANVRGRIILKEVTLNIYANIIKVDKKIYYSPLSNRRNSRAVMIVLNDDEDELYKFVNEYLEYFIHPNPGARTCRNFHTSPVTANSVSSAELEP